MKKTKGVSTRVPVIVANWKMHLTVAQSASVIRRLRKLLRGVRGVEVWIAPSFTALEGAKKVIAGSGFGLAAQNVHWADQGGFTGEISPVQLKNLGCRAVIIGHSERRHVFRETPEMIRKRTEGAVSRGLKVIFCVGETLRERRSGSTARIIRRQLDSGLAGIQPDRYRKITVAYEPVWAIGTGQAATESQVQKTHDFIRKVLVRRFGILGGNKICILYGGSVSPENIESFSKIENVDGVLVGGASLDPGRFARIVKSVIKVKREV